MFKKKLFDLRGDEGTIRWEGESSYPLLETFEEQPSLILVRWDIVNYKYWQLG